MSSKAASCPLMARSCGVSGSSCSARMGAEARLTCAPVTWHPQLTRTSRITLCCRRVGGGGGWTSSGLQWHGCQGQGLIWCMTNQLRMEDISPGAMAEQAGCLRCTVGLCPQNTDRQMQTQSLPGWSEQTSADPTVLQCPARCRPQQHRLAGMHPGLKCPTRGRQARLVAARAAQDPMAACPLPS